MRQWSLVLCLFIIRLEKVRHNGRDSIESRLAGRRCLNGAELIACLKRWEAVVVRMRWARGFICAIQRHRDVIGVERLAVGIRIYVCNKVAWIQ